uniref:uncharacterized protein LOC118151635 n=1 Tax=Callithrix jacchus TaxID=9483 RepID=UPI00159E6863|nr:uncharacterized protein LOC118151635 [Callithrix jacchus]
MRLGLRSAREVLPSACCRVNLVFLGNQNQDPGVPQVGKTRLPKQKPAPSFGSSQIPVFFLPGLPPHPTPHPPSLAAAPLAPSAFSRAGKGSGRAGGCGAGRGGGRRPPGPHGTGPQGAPPYRLWVPVQPLGERGAAEGPGSLTSSGWCLASGGGSLPARRRSPELGASWSAAAAVVAAAATAAAAAAAASAFLALAPPPLPAQRPPPRASARPASLLPRSPPAAFPSLQPGAPPASPPLPPARCSPPPALPLLPPYPSLRRRPSPLLQPQHARLHFTPPSSGPSPPLPSSTVTPISLPSSILVPPFPPPLPPPSNPVPRQCFLTALYSDPPPPPLSSPPFRCPPSPFPRRAWAVRGLLSLSLSLPPPPLLIYSERLEKCLGSRSDLGSCLEVMPDAQGTSYASQTPVQPAPDDGCDSATTAGSEVGVSPSCASGRRSCKRIAHLGRLRTCIYTRRRTRGAEPRRLQLQGGAAAEVQVAELATSPLGGCSRDLGEEGGKRRGERGRRCF